jgi:hypothetical protein
VMGVLSEARTGCSSLVELEVDGVRRRFEEDEERRFGIRKENRREKRDFGAIFCRAGSAAAGSS